MENANKNNQKITDAMESLLIETGRFIITTFNESMIETVEEAGKSVRQCMA